MHKHSRRSGIRRSIGSIATLAGALSVLSAACGGKVVIEDGFSGSGGAGGSSSSTPTSNVGTTVVSATVVTVGQGPNAVTAVTSGPMDCVGCAEFLTNGSNGVLCPESGQLYDALLGCVCKEACIPQCSDNACSGGQGTDDCTSCVQKLCQDEFNACANDF
jgi:hypothetical protein